MAPRTSYSAQLVRATARFLGLSRTTERSGLKCVGCDVKAWSVDGPTESTPQEGTVNEDGSFEIPDLPPGVYDIELTSDQGTPEDPSDDQGEIQENVVVLPGEASNLGFLQLDQMGALSGQVSLIDQGVPTEVRVWIPGTSKSAVTDSQGNWELDLVPAGNALFSLPKPGTPRKSRHRGHCTGTDDCCHGRTCSRGRPSQGN